MIINRPIRVGVIGAGRMGWNHLRVYGMLKNVDIVGLYDPNPEAAASVSGQFSCRAFDSLDQLLQAVDAVSVCSPSSTHGHIGLQALQAGMPVRVRS